MKSSHLVLLYTLAAALAAAIPTESLAQPGPVVPTKFKAQASIPVYHIAFAFAPDETVLLSDAKQNWFWEPLQNILTADKYGPYHSFDGLRDFFVAEHNTGIEVYEIGVGWTYLGSGYSPTVDFAANAIAYVDPSIEGILVWYPGNPIPIRYLYLDGIQEWEPEIYKDFIAYDYYDPTKNNWDVAVHDIRTNTNVAVVPDNGNELNADIWDNFVAFEVDQKQIVRYNLSTGAYEPAKVPGGCSGFIEPKLAGKYFVIFAATGCKSKDQLWLYDYIDKKLWSSSTTSVRTAIPATTPSRIGSYTSTNRSCPYTSSSICSDSRSPVNPA